MAENELKPIEVDIDAIIIEAGVFGKFQLLTYLLLLFPIIFTSMHANSYIFSAPDTEYRCKIPNCDGLNLEFEPSWQGNAIPNIKDKLDKFSKCDMYHQIKNESSLKFENEECPAEWFNKQIQEKCSEYIFKHDDSFIEEIDIPCDDFKRALIGTLHSFGTLLALPLIGYISDRYGRKMALILSAILEGLFGVVKAFSVNYAMFLSFEILEPTFGSGVYSSAYILGLEVLVPSTRVFGGSMINVFFAVGQVCMGLVAWGFPYWRMFLLVTSAPMVLFALYHYWILESSRWLSSKGRYEDIISNMKRIAKINGKTLSEKSLEPLYFNAENKAKFKELENIKASKENIDNEVLPYMLVIKSKMMIARLFKCSFWWITCTFCFYGLSLNAVNLGGNAYLNFIYSALMEIPAHIVAFFTLNKIGRKWTLFVAFLISGICNFAFAFIPEDIHWLSLLTYMLGKLFITMAFNGIYLYTSELFPTSLRHSLLAFCSMLGRIGSIVAPLTPLLSVYMEALPSILFGSTCIISALMMLTSPETLNLRLPETVEEAEHIANLKIQQ